MIVDLPAVLMIAKAQQKQIKMIEKRPCHCITLTDSFGKSRLQFPVEVGVVISKVGVEVSSLLTKHAVVPDLNWKYLNK